MGGGLVADGSAAHLSEDKSMLDSGFQQKPSSRTLVLVGRLGNGKSATGNSILGRQAFKSKGRASGVTTACELQSTELPNGQTLNVIDTPGLFSLSPSTEFTCGEILKCLRLFKEGIDAVILVFSLRSRLTEEERSVVFALQILFGSKVLDYVIVVFTNEDALEDDGDTLDEYLKDSPEFDEILKSCGGRKVLFGNRAKAPQSQKAKQVQELLNYVEGIAMENGKTYLDDISHEIWESEREQKHSDNFEKKGWFTKQETFQRMGKIENSREHEQFSEMMEMVETRLREAINSLEKQLNKEQTARLELEKRSYEVQIRSNDDIETLRKELEKAKQIAKELEEKSNKGCTIL